ncbi:hypothetical protein E4U35_001330 [Claviceps purpurea]|nr:hypothetical protein E4U35_001330 [Claviceps purpurea]
MVPQDALLRAPKRQKRMGLTFIATLVVLRFTKKRVDASGTQSGDDNDPAGVVNVELLPSPSNSRCFACASWPLADMTSSTTGILLLVQMITSPDHALGPIVAGRIIAGLGVGF